MTKINFNDFLRNFWTFRELRGIFSESQYSFDFFRKFRGSFGNFTDVRKRSQGFRWIFHGLHWIFHGFCWIFEIIAISLEFSWTFLWFSDDFLWILSIFGIFLEFSRSSQNFLWISKFLWIHKHSNIFYGFSRFSSISENFSKYRDEVPKYHSLKLPGTSSSNSCRVFNQSETLAAAAKAKCTRIISTTAVHPIIPKLLTVNPEIVIYLYLTKIEHSLRLFVIQPNWCLSFSCL